MFRMLLKSLRSFQFLQLSIFLLILFMLFPLMIEHRLIMFFMEIAFLNALLVSFSASGVRQHRFSWAIFILWALAAGVAIVGRYWLYPDIIGWLVILSLSLYALFLLGCVVLILSHIFHCRSLKSDGIFAAVAAYLLIVLLFANIYSICLVLDPHSFVPTLEFGKNAIAGMSLEMTYFSLITITTVGYGHLSPSNPFVKMLAGVEAVLGTLYLAVLIAWLLGMSLSVFRNRDAP